MVQSYLSCEWWSGAEGGVWYSLACHVSGGVGQREECGAVQSYLLFFCVCFQVSKAHSQLTQYLDRYR